MVYTGTQVLNCQHHNYSGKNGNSTALYSNYLPPGLVWYSYKTVGYAANLSAKYSTVRVWYSYKTVDYMANLSAKYSTVRYSIINSPLPHTPVSLEVKQILANHSHYAVWTL